MIMISKKHKRKIVKEEEKDRVVVKKMESKKEEIRVARKLKMTKTNLKYFKK